MGYKQVMVIKSVVCLVFGVILMVAPVALFGLLGATLMAGGIFAAREYSASLFGNMLLTWFARNAVDSDARRAIILALFVYDAVGVAISVVATLAGVLNPLGWLVAVVYLFFTWAFGRLLKVKGSAAPSPRRVPTEEKAGTLK